MIKGLLLSLCFLFLFSCSKIETGLQLAPRIVGGRVDDAFDFKSEKLSNLRKQIASDISANKKQLALRLVGHIDAILELSKKDKITPENVKAFIDVLKATQEVAVTDFKASFEVALADMQEKEISHFKRYADKKYKDDMEDTEDKKDFLKGRRKSILKTYGYFFSDITDQQEKLVEAFVDRHYDYFVERIKIRKSFNDNFLVKLNSKSATIDFVMNYYAGSIKEFSTGPVKSYLDDFYKFQADFWNMTSPKERDNFRKNINAYRDELKKIAGM